MRIHLLAPPNVQTTKQYSLDGFGIATIKFARMMNNLGHTVFLYGSEDNEAPCYELVTVITKEEQQNCLGKTPYQYAALGDHFGIWHLSNERINKEIEIRKQPRDLICTIGGVSHVDIAKHHSDLMTVEYSIGYKGSFSKYRVYQSHTWRHFSHGRQGNEHGNFFDDVIPYFFDEAEFKPAAKKEPFAVYVGRLTPNKGIGIACQAAKLAGIPLKVIGHGDEKLVTDGAEYLGALPDEERNDYMARATALLSPTAYLEPFGSVAVEAQLLGTPVISTNFGAFVETVEHGMTGFRCNYLGEFVRGLKAAAELDPTYIRNRAVKKYSMNKIQYDYQKYFDRLNLLWDEGWNTI